MSEHFFESVVATGETGNGVWVFIHDIGEKGKCMVKAMKYELDFAIGW
jgi:hypothetical protein